MWLLLRSLGERSDTGPKVPEFFQEKIISFLGKLLYMEMLNKDK